MQYFAVLPYLHLRVYSSRLVTLDQCDLQARSMSIIRSNPFQKKNLSGHFAMSVCAYMLF